MATYAFVRPAEAKRGGTEKNSQNNSRLRNDSLPNKQPLQNPPLESFSKVLIKNASATKRYAEGLLWLVGFGFLLADALTTPSPYRPLPAIAWAATTLIVVPLHFLKAWRKLRAMPNNARYAARVVFQSLSVLGLIGGMVWLSVSDPHSPARSRERVLRSNLQAMRSILGQYSIDLHRRPQSLDELVSTGYLREIPTDPMTKHNDSWVLEWSNDAKNPGIANIHSSSQSTSTQGTKYCDW